MASTSSSIPLYREINECHEATGFPLHTDLPEFHVFGIEETYPCARSAMPPFRRGFYQLTLLESMEGAEINFEEASVAGAENVLVFSPPEQLMSWVCGGSEKGFILYFKAELLTGLGRSIEELFPFFELTAPSVLPLENEDRLHLYAHFQALRSAANSRHAYRLPQLAAQTAALLYECRGLYDRLGAGQPDRLGAPSVVARFRQMVARCFSHHCSVESYAESLHISADHLRAVVKKHTGRTARDLIDERLLLEARRLLAQTNLNVSEIAWHLQFTEPTHFARFFKRYTGRTPMEFRRESARPAVVA